MGHSECGKEECKNGISDGRGVYDCRCMKSGKQPQRRGAQDMVATKEETKAGARIRWRRHKEEGESEEDTSDGVRDLGDEMDGVRSASEEEGERIGRYQRRVVGKCSGSR